MCGYIAPFSWSEEKFHYDIENEKHADPELDIHILLACQKLNIVERIPGYQHNQSYGCYQYKRMEYLHYDSVASG